MTPFAIVAVKIAQAIGWQLEEYNHSGGGNILIPYMQRRPTNIGRLSRPELWLLFARSGNYDSDNKQDLLLVETPSEIEGGFCVGPVKVYDIVCVTNIFYHSDKEGRVYCRYPWQMVNPLYFNGVPTVTVFMQAVMKDCPFNMVLIYDETQLPA